MPVIWINADNMQPKAQQEVFAYWSKGYGEDGDEENYDIIQYDHTKREWFEMIDGRRYSVGAPDKWTPFTRPPTTRTQGTRLGFYLSALSPRDTGVS